MVEGAARPRIAVVVKGYPRLSETFIAQEILGLERRGLDLLIVSLRHPTDPTQHDLHRAIRAPVLYLPEYLYQEPLRVLRAWWRARRLKSYRRVRSLWWADLRRDFTTNRGRRFGQALVLATELPKDVGRLYAHYLHTPASVTRYAARLLGIDWCASAHAKDIWITPTWEKQEKLRDCLWTTTCTAIGAKHLRELAPEREVVLIHHGLDAARFPWPDRRPGPDGSDPNAPVRLLGVARLVPKKGVDVLLDALAQLPADLHWHYDHVGGGRLQERLRSQAERLGLAARVTWRGPLPSDAVLEAYRSADLMVMACRIGDDGDRDGLPNALLEAASQELAIVASRITAIPELIEDGVEGCLVPAEDLFALRDAIAALIGDPATRLRLGRAGRARVLADFAMEPGLDRLAARLAGAKASRKSAAA